MKKTLLFHDTFLMRGGAERMNIAIAKSLDADIATAVWSRDCYNPDDMGFEGEIFQTYPDFRKGMVGFLKMKWSFLKSKKLLEHYSQVLFSNEAISGIWGVKPGTKTYYYAHSISRHLFDQREDYIRKVPFYLRGVFRIFSLFLREMYKKEISKVGTIFVNSKENQKNISTLLGRKDAVVIYPSVDTNTFDIFDKNTILQILAKENIEPSYKEYFISFSRLTHAKRIDTIIRAFGKIPDKNILILYGENDSQKDEFINLGKKYPNVFFQRLSDNKNLPYIINGSIANICISKNEDFGMVAIESMACGIPAIGVKEGGFRENIIDTETGYLIDSTNLENNLIDLIKKTPIEIYQSLGENCRIHAEKFSEKNMIEKIRTYIL